MKMPDHETLQEWLSLDQDGALKPAERTLLADHVAVCDACRRHRDQLVALDRLLAAERLPVRPKFRQMVMASLPPAGWEARAPRTWRLPAAAVVLFGSMAAALAVSGSGAGNAPGFAPLLAVAEMLQAATLAGAGLLNASWKGLGMVVGDVIASPASMAMFAFLVICLNLLVISLVRRRRPAAAATSQLRS
jgi:anti-sigma factor ChrR (cupin superfamily)